MLNHVIWEITIVKGNYYPEFRSDGVLKGEIGTKIQREHVFKRKKIVADILSSTGNISSIIDSIVHCVVTKTEHEKLKNDHSLDGWDRYPKAGIEVYRFNKDKPVKC